jgi:hypothetical protein
MKKSEEFALIDKTHAEFDAWCYENRDLILAALICYEENNGGR